MQAMLLAVLASTCLAEVATVPWPFLHPLFTNHMVLQRDMPFEIQLGSPKSDTARLSGH